MNIRDRVAVAQLQEKIDAMEKQLVRLETETAKLESLVGLFVANTETESDSYGGSD